MIEVLERQKAEIENKIHAEKQREAEFLKDHGDIKKTMFKYISQYVGDETCTWNIIRKIFPAIGDYINSIKKSAVNVDYDFGITWYPCSDKPKVGKTVLTYCRYYAFDKFEYIWNFVNSLGEWNNTSTGGGRGSSGLIPLFWCYFSYPDLPITEEEQWQ